MTQKPTFSSNTTPLQVDKGFLKSLQRPGQLIQTGSPESICASLQQLEHNESKRKSIKEATILIQGDEIKPKNTACLCITVVCGCLLCLPWLCFCYDYWKKKVWSMHAVPLQAYQKLEVLLRSSSLKTFNLSVIDNTFDKEKANCLYRILSKSSLTQFKFVNHAVPVDWSDHEYTNFVENILQIKQLQKIKSTLSWHTKLIT